MLAFIVMSYTGILYQFLDPTWNAVDNPAKIDL